MNKEIGNNTIIYADRPLRGYHYGITSGWLGSFLLLSGWSIGLYLESRDYPRSEDTVFLAVLVLLASLNGLVLWKKVKSMLSAGREKPLMSIGKGGIAVMDEGLCSWEQISAIRLYAEFDQHFMNLCFADGSQVKTYRLHSPVEVTEFDDLDGLKVLLEKSCSKVLTGKG